MSSNELTGPVPPELGNLRRLTYLAIDDNQLSGRLPRELIGIPLVTFHWNETYLCSPADREYVLWLERIVYHTRNRWC